MDLRSGLPFFLIKNGLLFNYPKPEDAVSTEVAILGGGISGALMAFHLNKAGIDCVVIDARTIGMGSTAASTSLLQYEIDVPLHELVTLRGYSDASRSFVLCKEAISKLKHIAAAVGMKSFHDRKSLFFTAKKKDVANMEKEFAIRKQAGFKVDYLMQDDIKSMYGFQSDAAILSHHGAQVDAYEFTHALLQHSITNGARVYDRSRIQKIQPVSGGFKLKTDSGTQIMAKKVINATGYEVVDFLDKKIVKLLSTYALITEHVSEETSAWNHDTMLWNTADPYLYMSSADNRIIVGGRDEDFYNPTRRDKLIKNKTRALIGDFKKLFPEMSLTPEFSWTGTFGSTKDGLPFIGNAGNNRDIYYALGFGGNGITFSLIAAEIITDLIRGKKNSDAPIFSFNRV